MKAYLQKGPRPELTSKNLEWLDRHQVAGVVDPDVPVKRLEYPAHDRSVGVDNFSSWSYFKKQESIRKDDLGHVTSKQAAGLWCEPLLARLDKQSSYHVTPVVSKGHLSGAQFQQENRAQKLRMRKAKVALNKWLAQEDPPQSDAATRAPSREGHRPHTKSQSMRNAGQQDVQRTVHKEKLQN